MSDNKCLEIKLAGVATDSTLRKLNEVRFVLLKRGDGSALSRLTVVSSTSDVIIKLKDGKGFLSTDSTASIGTSSIILSVGINTIYIKLSGDDTLSIENAQNLSSLGTVGFTFFSQLNASNSPFLSGDIKELSHMINLDTIFIQGFLGFTGDISVFSYLKKLKYVNINWTNLSGDIVSLTSSPLALFNANGTKITGDLNILAQKNTLQDLQIDETMISGSLSSLANSNVVVAWLSCLHIIGDINTLNERIRQLKLGRQTSGITFSGGAGFKFLSLDRLEIPNCSMSTQEVDNLLMMASKAVWTGVKNLSLKGVRSSASNTAISDLTSKGVTVIINI